MAMLTGDSSLDLFEQVRARLQKLIDEFPIAHGGERQHAWAPPADIILRNGMVVITLEVPGVAREQIDVTVTDHTVTISGKRDLPQVDGRLVSAERPSGQFRRSFALPWALDADHVKAQLKDGVLTVTIPRAGIKSIPVEDAGERDEADE